jgi:hypothetical protein
MQSTHRDEQQQILSLIRECKRFGPRKQVLTTPPEAPLFAQLSIQPAGYKIQPAAADCPETLDVCRKKVATFLKQKQDNENFSIC